MTNTIENTASRSDNPTAGLQSASANTILIKLKDSHSYNVIQVMTLDGTIKVYQRIHDIQEVKLTDEQLGQYTGLIYVTLMGSNGADMLHYFRG